MSIGHDTLAVAIAAFVTAFSVGIGCLRRARMRERAERRMRELPPKEKQNGLF